MSNKIYADNLTGYLVEGAKDKNYMKSSGKGYGDSSTSTPNTNYDSKNGVHMQGDKNWFEGNKGGNARGGWGAKGV